ncbi:hypothetical protein EV127DRAFT_486492 [Xylaria flabelliformis]|nr:hypothetical protein EV127DRAFT_486492 [Xylaria flabelliformis]KAI0857025.1 hypothetical protein F4860DRAFT_374857 [Xylaria cubensis]
MVTFNIAYTAPINKNGATPTLTQSQVWEGLKLKVRRAQDFVSAITECQVLSEETLPTGELQITRQVQFVPTTTHKANGAVKEVCVHYAPCRVAFQQEDGSTVTNIISKRPDGELLMSYVFEWRHPDVPEGSDRAAQLEEAHWKMAKMAVESSIDTIRRLVTEGKIQ